MNIEQMSKEDFYFIKANLPLFWGERYSVFEALHHPMFYFSFGNTAFVIKEQNQICAYMLGFFSQTEPTAYVHMVNVRAEYQKRGFAQALYEHFIQIARQKGMNKISAITSPHNQNSILFHRALGMKMSGEKNSAEMVVVKDYSGVGEDRVVFEMDINKRTE